MAERDSIACVAAGCEGMSCVKGMCTKHYWRMRTNGSFDLAEREKKRCKGCEVVMPPKSHRTYCTDECRESTRPIRNCLRCEKAFRPKKGRREKFCSKACSLIILTERSIERGALREEARLWACVPCRVCTNPCPKPHMRTCSEVCKGRWGQIRASKSNEARTCAVCNVRFCRIPGPASGKFCSEGCLREQERENRRGLGGSHRHRARRKGAAYEPINPLRIFERDGWKCRLCGVPTPKRLRGSCDPRAPELDHIIPFALGGGHLKTNVQCACRQCNADKGATARGQLHLL